MYFTSEPDKPIRTLLVDDEPLIRRVLSDTLQAAGYQVGTAKDGEEGFAKFQEQVWDVVVTDRTMPIVNGEQLAASIKRISPETPVILITGIKSAVYDASPFAAILQKPFRASHLLNAIEGCFTRVRG